MVGKRSVKIFENSGWDVWKLRKTRNGKARGGVSKECGAGGDEWGRTAFVQRTKEIRAINGVGRVPTIFIGSAHRSIHRVRRNNTIRIVIVAPPRCIFVHFLANIFVGSAEGNTTQPISRFLLRERFEKRWRDLV